ncbi:ATP synthase F1 subcomplex epsilon subunit [Ekhidna lutea]|uniref:ATP synthase F1 subcomplex epsilon subunit n=1 Tax=Ekhidna lutea TaxID=447679 RepID=A0A239IVY9_EKHLU|nr:ATP synthase F1 subunit epsilon [Ekhidna lutea]SNS97791.1 ATP synthase F1 subcomplex epsilon subunit [Ekhidna lutea]
MFLEIVTPDEKVFEGEVVSASFPGSDGSFQILNNHAAMVSTLGKGDIRYTPEKKPEVHLLVEGGVVEVMNNKVNVLVEKIFSE